MSYRDPVTVFEALGFDSTLRPEDLDLGGRIVRRCAHAIARAVAGEAVVEVDFTVDALAVVQLARLIHADRAEVARYVVEPNVETCFHIPMIAFAQYDPTHRVRQYLCERCGYSEHVRLAPPSPMNAIESPTYASVRFNANRRTDADTDASHVEQMIYEGARYVVDVKENGAGRAIVQLDFYD